MTEAVPAGFTRFLMKSTFGMGRDFAILDPADERQVYTVDGKVGARPRADILDASGAKVYDVTGRMLSIPKRMDVTDASGAQVAHLHGQPLKFIKDKIDITLASGEVLLLEGNLIEKDYAVRDSQGALKVQITQKWLTVRDRYTIDIADGIDPGMVFALVWAIDRWVERD